MRTIVLIPLLSCFLFEASAQGADPKKEAEYEVFTVEDIFSIETPPGFEWREASKIQVNDIKSVVYACQQEGSNTRIVLTVEQRKLTEDPERVATVKAHYNAMVDTLKNAGFTGMKVIRPNLKPPIKDRVMFSASGKTAEGTPAFVQAVTLFGENVYLLQVFADSRQEAVKLRKFADTLKDPLIEERQASAKTTESTKK